MDKELKKIKKLYGEAMMHFCRDNFALILDIPDLLLNILTSNFHPTHELYKDLEENDLLLEFKEYIFVINGKKKEKILKNGQSPEELMAKAGYDLSECLTEEDIQSFRKYYAKNEELCTFWTHRLRTNRVFFAVKKNVDEIKREDFPNPKRQDKYGTSVISIQFTKDGTNTLSIKNRYNHTVFNPDATFSNNLDNIIPGLTDSFEEYYGLKQQFTTKGFEIPGYILANDGKYYKYNYEMDNIYYCPDNIIINNFNVNKYAKEKYLVLDCFVLDLVNKEIFYYTNMGKSKSAFIDSIGIIKNIEIRNEEEEKKVLITPLKGEIIEIGLDKLNRLISFKNNNVKEVLSSFLSYNECLRKIEMNKVEHICYGFLYENKALKELFLPKVKSIDNSFLKKNQILETLSMPNLEQTENDFLFSNLKLKNVNLPKLKTVGSRFLFFNNALERLSLPSLEWVGWYFLEYNNVLKYLNLPKLQVAPEDFLSNNNNLEEAYFSNLEDTHAKFLANCWSSLRILIAPKLKSIGGLDPLTFYENHPNLEEFVTTDKSLNLSLKKKDSKVISN